MFWRIIGGRNVRARRVEDRSRHQRPVLGEGKRHRRRKLEPLEVVAICDHLVAFGASERKHEIAGRAAGVAFDLLVQTLGWYVVERGEVGIDHDFVAADDEDLPGDVRGDIKCRHYGLLRDAAVFHIGINGSETPVPVGFLADYPLEITV